MNNDNLQGVNELFIGPIPWIDSRGELGMGSRILLGRGIAYRNVPEMPFTATASSAQQEKILEYCSNWLFKMKEEEGKSDLDWKGAVSLDTMSVDGYRMFSERMVLPDLEGIHGSLDNDMRRVFFTPNGEQSIVIHGVEHLSWSHLLSGHDLLESVETNLWEQPSSALNLHEWASREDWGVWTSDIRYLGSGFQLQAFVHLPGILGRQNKKAQTHFFKSLQAMGLSCTRVNGWGELGNYLWICSKSHIGHTPEEVAKQFIETLKEIVEEEIKCEERWLQKNSDSLEDKVFRSLSLLLGARKLPFQEFLELSSWVQFGTYAGWISASALDVLRTLLVRGGVGHIQVGENEPLEVEEANKLRATMVRLTLQEAGL